MPVYLPSYFVALGLDETATEADVKAAYATRLKQLDRSRDPLGFQDLRGHYEAAIAHLRPCSDRSSSVILCRENIT